MTASALPCSRVWAAFSAAAPARRSAARRSPAARSASSSAWSAACRAATASPADRERFDESLRHRGEPVVLPEPGALEREPALAVAALALGPLGEPALGRQRGAELGAAGRGRALVGRAAALLEQPAGVADGLARLVAGAGGGAGGAVGLVAGGVGGGDGLRRALALGDRGLLGLRGALGGLHQLVAAVALGEQAILAAARHLAKLAGERRPDAAGAGDGDAAEVGTEPVEPLDDPDVGQQALRERGRRAPPSGSDAGEERLGARGG